MTRRKSILGILLLCMVALSAFSAANASAASRAYTCVLVNNGREFSDEHCDVPASGGEGFKLSLITTANTSFIATNEDTASETTAAEPSFLRGKIAGIEVEIKCTGLSGSGELTNSETSVSGTGTVSWSGCTVLKPAGRECKVKGGSISTNKLKASTAGQTEANMKFEPNTGTEFAKIPLEGCKENKPPAAEYPVAGSVVVSGLGATSSTTEAGVTAQGTLTFGGNAAGLGGAWTTRMGGVPNNPIVRK